MATLQGILAAGCWLLVSGCCPPPPVGEFGRARPDEHPFGQGCCRKKQLTDFLNL